MNKLGSRSVRLAGLIATAAAAVIGTVAHTSAGAPLQWCQRPSRCPRVWPSAVLAGGHRNSSGLGLLSTGGAVGEPVAVAAGGDDVGVVAEPVEQGHGGGLVG
jgi:hypothetical protein